MGTKLFLFTHRYPLGLAAPPCVQRSADRAQREESAEGESTGHASRGSMAPPVCHGDQTHGTAEELIGAELPHLCAKFSSVYLIPTHPAAAPSMGAKEAETPLPDGVILIRDALEEIRKRRALHPVRQGQRWLSNAHSRALLAAELPRALRHGPFAVQRAFDFLQRADALRDVALQLLRRFGGDTVLYSYWLTQAALGISLLKPRANLLRIARAHHQDLYEDQHRPPYRPFQRAAVRNLDRTIPVSEHGRRYLYDRYPEAAERVLLHRLGTHCARKRARPSNEGTLHVLSSSALTCNARVETIARAIRQARIPVRWTHIGDGEQRRAVQARLKHLPKRVHAELLGALPHAEVLRMHETQPVDVFLHVGQDECASISIMRALSYGIPIIASDAGGIGELIDDRCARLLSPNPSAAETARALESFADLDDTKKKAMRERAYIAWQQGADASAVFPPFAEHIAHLQEAAML